MPQFVHTASFPFDRSTVFAWHERPGAFVRLSPPAMGRVTAQPSDGLQVGSIAQLSVGLPLTDGRLGLPWRARHVAYDPPNSFEDVMESGPLKSWHHRHLFADGESANETVITDKITYELPTPAGRFIAPLAAPIIKKQLRAMFDFRTSQLRADLAFHAAHPEPKVIAVSGAKGLVGRQLVALLGGGGHEVRVLSRSGSGSNQKDKAPGTISWDPDTGRIDPEALRDVDVVIHLGGEPIGKRFTPKHKFEVLRSRTRSTATLARALAEVAGDGRDRALVVASAAGYYGADRGDEVLTEDSAPGDDFLATVCRDWEAAADPARDAGVRVAHIRIGYVQAADGGQLALQLPIYQAGLGGRLGDGRQWMPWIALDDLITLIAHVALTQGLHGPVNACAPHPVRQADYAKALGKVLHRPAILPVPEVGPRLLLGREGAQELALAGQRMSADRAISWGHTFRFPDIDPGLRHVLAR